MVSNHSSNVSGVLPIEECNMATTIAKDEVDMNVATAGTAECGSEPLWEEKMAMRTTARSLDIQFQVVCLEFPTNSSA